jgi:uncharacterized protein YheU (UPF0270 family)
MKIPVETLSDETLAGIIEAFVLREGTDYGHEDHELADKCAAVRSQLMAGTAEIDFDPTTDTIDIRPVPEVRDGGRAEPGVPRTKVPRTKVPRTKIPPTKVSPGKGPVTKKAPPEV